MRASQAPTDKLSAQAAPLSPARAALARAIEELNEAPDRLRQAQDPLHEIDRIRVAATCREASELRAAIGRLRCAHEAEVAAWVDSGAKAVRPMPASRLLDAEIRLGEIAGCVFR